MNGMNRSRRSLWPARAPLRTGSESPAWQQLTAAPTRFAGPRPHGDHVTVPAGAGKALLVLCDAVHFGWHGSWTISPVVGQMTPQLPEVGTVSSARMVTVSGDGAPNAVQRDVSTARPAGVAVRHRPARDHEQVRPTTTLGCGAPPALLLRIGSATSWWWLPTGSSCGGPASADRDRRALRLPRPRRSRRPLVDPFPRVDRSHYAYAQRCFRSRSNPNTALDLRAPPPNMRPVAQCALDEIRG